jgi:hemolysin D
LHVTVLFSIAIFVTTVAMSFVFRVEVVARGEGRVIPVTRVQVVQPEFQGRIVAIRVRNGMSVEKGEVLIEMDSTEAIAQLGTIKAEQDRLRIETARIDAMVEALGISPSHPEFFERVSTFFKLPENLRGHPFADEQLDLLMAESDDLATSLRQMDARELAIRKSEAVTDANIARIEAALEIQAVRLRTANELLSRGASSRSAFLDVQQAYVELQRQRDVFLREREQKAAEQTALNAERRRVVTDLRSSLLQRKAQIDSRLATLSEEERAARRKVTAATLRAPVSGIVDQLQVFTVGGVTDAGTELLRIVPTDGAIELEAVFSNQDIGFLQVGQQANIRLDAYPSERFGFVRGQVSDIAADSTEVSEKQWGYVVRIAPDKPFLQAGPNRFPLRPGMTATIDVITDTRRIISYFFAPILRTLQDAMGER